MIGRALARTSPVTASARPGPAFHEDSDLGLSGTTARDAETQVDQLVFSGLESTRATVFPVPVLDILSFYLLPTTEVDDFTTALELWAELGGRYAMAIGDDPEWTRMRDNLGRLCDAAAPLGLTIVIEFVPHHRILATLPMALQILAATGRANGAICLDPLHLARSGGSPADLAGLDARFFPYAQLSDGVFGPGEPDLALAQQRGIGERRLLGEGSLPLRELLAALPLGIPLSVELPMPRTMRDPAGEWARIALQNARDFLAGLEHSGPG